MTVTIVAIEGCVASTRLGPVVSLGDLSELPFESVDPIEPACRFEYAAQNRGRVERGLEGRDSVERVPHDGDAYEVVVDVESGPQTFRVVSSPRGFDPDAEHVWRVERASGTSTNLGRNVQISEPPEIVPDGKGAFLISWTETESYDRGLAIVTSRSTIPIDPRGGLGPASNRISRVTGGWVVSVPDGDGRRLERVDESGAAIATSRLGGCSDALVAEDAVEELFVLANCRDGLRFGRLDRFESSVRLGATDGVWERVELESVVEARDGFWLIVTESWQVDHFSPAPPETRFIRVARDGSEVGRLHARSRTMGSTRVEDVRSVNDELRLRVARPRDGDRWFEVAIVDASPCRQAVPRPCDPWAETGETSQRDESPNAALGPGFADVERRLIVSGLRILGEPILQDGHILFVTIHREGEVALRTVDAISGRDLESHVLPTRGAGGAGILVADGELLGCVDGSEGLVMFDANGIERTRIPGGWFTCSVYRTRDHIIVATSRVLREGVVGPETLSTLLLLTPDRLEVVDDRSIVDVGPRSRFVADGETTWVLFQGRHEHDVLRLDASDRPIGDPRRLATLYFGTRTEIVRTPAGPALAWWRPDAHGVVPFCFVSPSR